MKAGIKGIIIKPLVTIFLIAMTLNCDGYRPEDVVLNHNLENLESKCIVMYGDTRTHQDIHRRLVDIITLLKPKAVFHSGDQVDNGNDKRQWREFNEVVSGITAGGNYYTALGNHENNSSLYFENFRLPGNQRWYTVEIENILFIVLDTNSEVAVNSEQYRWLEEVLTNVGEGIGYTIMVFHHSPYSSGPMKEDEKGLRQSIVPLFEKYGVDMVISGHDHSYERVLRNGIHYIVSGGGGAPLYGKRRTIEGSRVFLKVHHFCCLYKDGENLVLKAYDIKQNEIDSLILQPKK